MHFFDKFPKNLEKTQASFNLRHSLFRKDPSFSIRFLYYLFLYNCWVENLDLGEFVDNYFHWPNREKWFILRDIAYERLRTKFFSSPETLDVVSEPDFRKEYLSFGSAILNNLEYKLTVSGIPRFLQRFSASQLEESANKGELGYVGNASWSQLHMGFKKDRWNQTRESIKFLLFGNENEQLSETNEYLIYNRLGRVLQTDLAIPGFGRAKVTPLLLICDKNQRFGVWNSVSDEALDVIGLKRKSNITKSRKLSEYICFNKELNKFKVEYGFTDLIDTDLFAWYFLDQIKIKGKKRPGTGKKKPLTPPEPDFHKEILCFEKELRMFIDEKLRNEYSDLWILRMPKDIRNNWEIRRQTDIKQGRTPEPKLINYVDFSDYIELIKFNWKLFGKFFQNRNVTTVRLNDLKRCRNATMHGRTLSNDEIGLGRTSMGWLRSKMRNNGY